MSAVCADVTKVKPVDQIHTEAFSGQCLPKKAYKGEAFKYQRVI